MTDVLRIAGLFAGIGGLDAGVALGIEEAGIPVEHTALVEREPFPRRVLAARFPGVPLLEDVREVRGEDLGGADVVVGGFPCFPAGTLIETVEGLRPIETLAIGDLVYTHKKRFRRVTCTMRKQDAPLLVVKATGGIPLRCTPEHPFFARVRTREWNKARRRHDRVFSEPSWVEAKDLTKDHFLAQPIRESVDAFSAQSPDFWELVGRYLGDGWIVDYPRKGRPVSRMKKVLICCALKEQEELRDLIERAGFHATLALERTVAKFHISSKDFVDFLRPFGKYAHGKCVPGFVFDLPLEHLRAFWKGYIGADGSDLKSVKGVRITTVSKELCLGMANLARVVHQRAVSVIHTPRPSKTFIEGREVNQRDTFDVFVYDKNKVSFVEDGFAWVPVRSVTETNETSEVFNISVEEDESYTADGFVVHNCQDVSGAKRDAQGLAGERSGLWSEQRRIIEEAQPYFAVVENVEALLRRGLWKVLADLHAAGYVAQYDVLTAHSVGAPHQRERVFVLAQRRDAFDYLGGRFNAGRFARFQPHDTGLWSGARAAWPYPWAESRAAVVAPVKALGNAVVPAMAAVVGRGLGELMRGRGVPCPHGDGRALGQATRMPRAGCVGPDGLLHALPSATKRATARDALDEQELKGTREDRTRELAARIKARRLPTPTATDWKGGGVGGAWHRNLKQGLGGMPSPAFLEWVMGFPEGWTDV